MPKNFSGAPSVEYLKHPPEFDKTPTGGKRGQAAKLLQSAKVDQWFTLQFTSEDVPEWKNRLYSEVHDWQRFLSHARTLGLEYRSKTQYNDEKRIATLFVQRLK